MLDTTGGLLRHDSGLLAAAIVRSIGLEAPAGDG
jgi:hypothetical protein